ncbi:unnamed protein product [Penicillium viridicatum]
MPEFNGTTGHFEMTPVHSAASQLAENLVKTPTQESTLLKFLHLGCPIRIGIAEMVAFLEGQRGGKGLERVPGLNLKYVRLKTGIQKLNTIGVTTVLKALDQGHFTS